MNWFSTCCVYVCLQREGVEKKTKTRGTWVKKKKWKEEPQSKEFGQAPEAEKGKETNSTFTALKEPALPTSQFQTHKIHCRFLTSKTAREYICVV